MIRSGVSKCVLAAASDSFVASFSFTLSLFGRTISPRSVITGGTGAFNGASGSLAATLTLKDDGSHALTGTGTTEPVSRIVNARNGHPVRRQLRIAGHASGEWIDAGWIAAGPAGMPGRRNPSELNLRWINRPGAVPVEPDKSGCDGE
jgi:hypothetical protein